MPKTLTLNFHGRVIDHLGYQMYHSPVAVISEMVSNSWDADAERVEITLPDALDASAEIVIFDDGNGMTFDDCQNRFLNVGYDRREGNPDAKSSLKKRDVLGRKGIGKFAGFGISQKIEVVSVSLETGEKTCFELDLEKLRGKSYEGGQKEINVKEYLPPDEERKAQHGTIIKLHPLLLKRNISESSFIRSMGRRFLLHKRAKDFTVEINGKELNEEEVPDSVEYSFPKDYLETEKGKISELVIDGSWGSEPIDEVNVVKWNIVFYKEPIDDEELRGISIFANGKLAQAPFLFNIVGGVGGQNGLEYISGRIEADFIDSFDEDIIATERQRINWELDESQSLLAWGQKKIKDLLKLWVARRTESRLAELNARISPFGERLGTLPGFERRIVEGTLTKLASIPRLSYENFESLSISVITAWEGGRLRELIHKMSEAETMEESDLLNILLETNVLTALHTAEAVKVKLDAIRGLEDRVARKDLENAIRDYIGEHPWLISPKWETFKIEKNVANVVKSAATEAKLNTEEDWKGRIDLTLSSGDQLLILEFMRPGVKVDLDHINRFEEYILAVDNYLGPNSGGVFRNVAGGYLIADTLHNSLTIKGKLDRLAQHNLLAMDWPTLLAHAKNQWKEFLDILAARAPEDKRIMALIEDEETD